MNEHEAARNLALQTELSGLQAALADHATPVDDIGSRLQRLITLGTAFPPFQEAKLLEQLGGIVISGRLDDGWGIELDKQVALRLMTLGTPSQDRPAQAAVPPHVLAFAYDRYATLAATYRWEPPHKIRELHNYARYVSDPIAWERQQRTRHIATRVAVHALTYALTRKQRRSHQRITS